MSRVCCSSCVMMFVSDLCAQGVRWRIGRCLASICLVTTASPTSCFAEIPVLGADDQARRISTTMAIVFRIDANTPKPWRTDRKRRNGTEEQEPKHKGRSPKRRGGGGRKVGHPSFIRIHRPLGFILVYMSGDISIYDVCGSDWSIRVRVFNFIPRFRHLFWTNSVK